VQKPGGAVFRPLSEGARAKNNFRTPFSKTYITQLFIAGRPVMTKKSDTTFVSIMHPVCCVPDIHKDKISVCLITVNPFGVPQYKGREFSAFTDSFFG
jgi:hypothetical protein